MRSRALSVDALEQLGARQLAELLMAQAKGDPALARSLRLVLAGTDGGTRLASGRAGSSSGTRCDRWSVGSRGCARRSPAPLAAAAQMRLFPDLAAGVFERSDDGSSSLGDVFLEAGADLRRIWALPPGRNPVALAAGLLALLDADG